MTSYGYDLEGGERAEQLLCDALNHNYGLQAYRPRQRFVDGKSLRRDHNSYIEWLEMGYPNEVLCNVRLADPRYHQRIITGSGWNRATEGCVLPGDPRPIDKSLLRSHQRDVMIKLDAVRRLSVEVKTLTARAFEFPYIHVGCCPKWDEKQFRVDALILINQQTGEARVHSGAKSEMVLRPSIEEPTGKDYAIKAFDLMSLEGWVRCIKLVHDL